MLRPGARKRELVHSGYVDSLPDDLQGDWPTQESLSSRTPSVSDISLDGQIIPNLHPDNYPTHFEHPPLRHCFEDPPVLTEGRLKAPAALTQDQPLSWLHSPPSNYLGSVPENITGRLFILTNFFLSKSVDRGQTEMSSTHTSSGRRGSKLRKIRY